jgi:hypothetical protein
MALVTHRACSAQCTEDRINATEAAWCLCLKRVHVDDYLQQQQQQTPSTLLKLPAASV